MRLSLAVAGKGGTGKTTLSAMLVRALRDTGIRPILAVDADPNSCLADALGVESGKALADIREQGSSPEGSPPSGVGRARAVDDEIHRAITEADGFDLVAMGRPEGPRCYCYVNNLLRQSLDSLTRSYEALVLDNEAGMEHLSRRTTNDVDFLVSVVNPTLPSLRAAQRILAMSRQLPVKIGHRLVLVNRAGGNGMAKEVERLLAELEADRLVDVPQDNNVEAAGPRGAVCSVCQRIPLRWLPSRTWWSNYARNNTKTQVDLRRNIMSVPDAKENWSGQITTVTLGATKADGGTRGSTVTIGGQSGIPFMSFDGPHPNPAAIALDVLDKEPVDWPEPLAEVYSDVWSDPAAWACKVKELGADLINLRLLSTHPDEGDRSPEEAATTVKAILEAVDLPLIIWGCDVPEKDQKVMPKVAEAAQGENCLLGAVIEDEYRTLTAAAQAYGHKLIALSPCDINKAKQVNILVNDTGYPVEDIVIYPSTAALGYGMEYIYSILERGRLAALAGDKLMAQPVILDVGYEAWRAKEARAGDDMAELWGPVAQRGPAWEAMTAADLLQGGCDLLVMRHPKAMEVVRNTVTQLIGQ